MPGPILLLYWNPEVGPTRNAVTDHLAAVAAAAPADHVYAFNAVGGAPARLALLNPSAVVLHTTFLGFRWLAGFERLREQSAWLAQLDVPKVALPQDDYDFADTLDEWLSDLGVTAVLTPLASYAALYPRTRGSARIKAVLTGYVNRSLAAELLSRLRDLRQRDIDVVYRATSLPYWYGRHGQLKRKVGEAAAEAARAAGWTADISTQQIIKGRAWFDHLASGRTVVGCESGSSVLDRRGDVRARIGELLRDDPEATFDEVSARMPAGWDGTVFGALSPRHLEAAVTRTPQVLVRGSYSGVLRPDVHYVPVCDDLSDIRDALERALDPGLGRELAEAAWADLVDSGRYDYDRLTEAVRGELPDTTGAVPRSARRRLFVPAAARAVRRWAAAKRPRRGP